MNDLHSLLFVFVQRCFLLKFSNLENFLFRFLVFFCSWFDCSLYFFTFCFLLFTCFFFDQGFFKKDEMKNTPLFICVLGLETRISTRTSLFRPLHSHSNTTRRIIFRTKIIIIAMRCVFRVWSTWWIWMQQFCHACDWILLISLAMRRLFAL